MCGQLQITLQWVHDIMVIDKIWSYAYMYTTSIYYPILNFQFDVDDIEMSQLWGTMHLVLVLSNFRRLAKQKLDVFPIFLSN